MSYSEYGNRIDDSLLIHRILHCDQIYLKIIENSTQPEKKPDLSQNRLIRGAVVKL
eukprot:COSAG02_NODE_3290_length_6997_cov_20.105973_8_plen_56_part_00